ncbi:divergent polysaccharide deacetylase family protein [Siccirubricoccus deserti]
MNAAVSENAIRRLPGAVTLAFSPYAPQLPLLLDQARAKGMELLVALPLEPTGYPLNNPGDRALLTGQTEAQNQDRLDWVLSASPAMSAPSAPSARCVASASPRSANATPCCRMRCAAAACFMSTPPGSTGAGAGLGPRHRPGGG